MYFNFHTVKDYTFFSQVFLADSNSFEVVKEAASYLQDVKLLEAAEADEDSRETGDADQFGTEASSREVEMVRRRDGKFVKIEPELRNPDLSPAKHHTLPIFEYHEPSYFGAHREDVDH